MSFDFGQCVAVISFCVMLYPWGKDISAIILLPVLAAICNPAYPVQSAFTAYVTVLFFGTLYFMISAMAEWKG